MGAVIFIAYHLVGLFTAYQCKRKIGSDLFKAMNQDSFIFWCFLASIAGAWPLVWGVMLGFSNMNRFLSFMFDIKNSFGENKDDESDGNS